MRRAIVLLAACGTPTTTNFDSAPPGLSVLLIAPNGGEGFYATDSVSVIWVAHDDISGDITCDVEARGATTIVIAGGVRTTSDQRQTTMWTPTGVEPGPFRIVVTCTDVMPRTASDESDADFAVTPPPRAVSFSGELAPIIVATCQGSICHGATPQANLQLTDGPTSYAELVDVPSIQCGLKLVDPGAPHSSYLIAKMVGANAGGCYTGDLMPKVDQPLQPDVIQAFRDWIANGAPNN